MSLSLNKVTLIGYLGKDPDVRYQQSGTKMVKLNLATKDVWRNADTGERHSETEWHRVVIFNEGIVELAEKYLMKGSRVYVEGQIKARSWENKEGIVTKTTEIIVGKNRGDLILLDSKEKKEEKQAEGLFEGLEADD